MSAWSVDLIGDLVHLIRPPSKEGDTVAVLRKKTSVQVGNRNQVSGCKFYSRSCPSRSRTISQACRKEEKTSPAEWKLGWPTSHNDNTFCYLRCHFTVWVRWEASSEGSVRSSLLCYIDYGILIRVSNSIRRGPLHNLRASRRPAQPCLNDVLESELHKHGFTRVYSRVYREYSKQNLFATNVNIMNM